MLQYRNPNNHCILGDARWLFSATYKLREEKDEPGAVDLYLEYPLSLSLDLLIPSSPSWVPDFSQNSPFLRVQEDITW